MKKLLISSALALAAAAAPASAAPVFNADNGHWYDFVRGQMTWGDALKAATAAPSIAGYSSYLATITSEQENTFIFSQVGNLGGWLGGTDEAVEGEWRWAAGPEAGQLFTYTNWGGGEPNNCCGGEDYLHNFSGSGIWNDLDNSNVPSYISGYYVEYSQGGNGVPEPAAWAMMLAGFGLVGAALRRREGAAVTA
jgi:hypothetical protein